MGVDKEVDIDDDEGDNIVGGNVYDDDIDEDNNGDKATGTEETDNSKMLIVANNEADSNDGMNEIDNDDKDDMKSHNKNEGNIQRRALTQPRIRNTNDIRNDTSAERIKKDEEGG